MLYVMIGLYQVFFYKEKDIQVNDSGYVPKSKRNKTWIRINSMTTWCRKQRGIIVQTLQDKMPQYTRHVRLKRAYRTEKQAHKKRHPGRIRMLAFAAVAMNAHASALDANIPFDSDSEPIGIDNRCSGCISHRIEDFDGPLIDSNRSIKDLADRERGI